ncbi:hypothetical protein KW448_19710 [Vibrio fluvialis]|nr:hypothetical protein [Vibrio fluvialis]
MILLVTNQRDLTTDYIVRELKSRELPYFRLNTENIPQYNCKIGYQHKDDWSIDKLTGSSITAAYFRRPGLPEPKTTSRGIDVKEYMQTEWQSLLKSIYARLDEKWLSSPIDISLAEDKPKQLLLANQLGFNVPDNIITNDIKPALELSQTHSLIVKPLRQALLQDEQEKVIFTNRAEGLSEEHTQSVGFSPIIFQQEIKKKYDVRVTVVGNKVFSTAIWSQSHTETSVDWRIGGHCDLKHELIILPESINNQCLQLTKLLNLKFSAIDLICDKNNKYWFLEINPNGQWAWIENQTQAPISRSIVDELVTISRSIS